MLTLAFFSSRLVLLFTLLKLLLIARLNNYFLDNHCLAVASLLRLGRLFYVRFFVDNFLRYFLFSLRTTVPGFPLVGASLLHNLMALGLLMVRCTSIILLVSCGWRFS